MSRKKTKRRTKVRRTKRKVRTDNTKVKWVPGYTWKTRKTETCPVCGCRSNLWKITKGKGNKMNKRLICPGEQKYPHSHEMLENKLNQLKIVGSENQSEMLEQEIESARFKFDRI